MSLIQNQPWLSNKTDLVEHLLFDECDNDLTRELIIELINRFEYLDNERYQLLMREIALEIVTEPNLFEQSTLISAMSIGSDADSGQAIIYSLKLLLQEQNWTKHKFVNDALHVFKTFKSNAQLKDIIIVDEFIGTGKTVLGRVKSIKEQFDRAELHDYNIKVKVLASTELGLNRILETGVDVTAKIILRKGISQYYDEGKIQEKIDLMLNFEKILSNKYNDREMPSLGYGQAESLYYRLNTNLPNSVFPIFWWAEYKTKKNRRTLLLRAMGDA